MRLLFFALSMWRSRDSTIFGKSRTFTSNTQPQLAIAALASWLSPRGVMEFQQAEDLSKLGERKFLLLVCILYMAMVDGRTDLQLRALCRGRGPSALGRAAVKGDPHTKVR